MDSTGHVDVRRCPSGLDVHEQRGQCSHRAAPVQPRARTLHRCLQRRPARANRTWPGPPARWLPFAQPVLTRESERSSASRCGSERCIRALNLYRDARADALGRRRRRADPHVAGLRAPGLLAAEMEAGADFQYVVHQASGMLAAHVNVTNELVRLRAYAFANDRPLADRGGRRSRSTGCPRGSREPTAASAAPGARIGSARSDLGRFTPPPARRSWVSISRRPTAA